MNHELIPLSNFHSYRLRKIIIAKGLMQFYFYNIQVLHKIVFLKLRAMKYSIYNNLKRLVGYSNQDSVRKAILF